MPNTNPVTVSGTTGYDGTYTHGGTYNGADYYERDGSHFLFWHTGQWNLSGALGSGGSGSHFYAAGTNAAVPTSGWAANLGTGTPVVSQGTVATPPAPYVQNIIGTDFETVGPDPFDPDWEYAPYDLMGKSSLDGADTGTEADVHSTESHAAGDIFRTSNVDRAIAKFQPNSHITIHWKMAGAAPPSVLGPDSDVCFAPLVGTITKTATTAAITAPGTRPAPVTARHAQLRHAITGVIQTSAAISNSATATFTGLNTGDPYQIRWRDTFTQSGDGENQSYSEWEPFTATAGEETNPNAPTAPGELRVTTHDISVDLVIPDKPVNADTLRVQQYISSVWTTVVSGLLGGETVNVGGLTADTDYNFRCVAVNSFGITAGPEAPVHTLETPSVSDPPTAPNAPYLAAKTATSAFIGQSAWPTNTTSMKLYRDGVLVHTFATSTEGPFEDTGVSDGDVYTLKASNAAGDSSASPGLTVSLASNTLTVNITAPANAATISGDTTVTFTAVDTTGDVSDPQVLLDGLPVGTPTLVSGTAQNGTYSITFSSKNYGSGSQVLQAKVTGSDGLDATDEIDVTVDNDLEHGTFFKDIVYLDPAPLGKVWKGATPGLQNNALSANIEQRWWQQWRLWTDESGFALDGVSYADKQAEWEDMQVVEPRPRQYHPASGTRPETRQMVGEVPLLDYPGQQIVWRMRWEPVEVVNWWTAAYDAGYERITKIREYAPGKFVVVAIKEDDSEAGIFDFDGTNMVEKVTLLAAPIDVAADANKIYVIADATTIEVYDRDTGDVVLELGIPGELRGFAFMEIVGEKPILIAVDDEAEEEQSTAYDLTFNTPRLVWTLDAIVTLTDVTGAELGLAAGMALYKSTNGTGAPVLSHTFGSNITALHAAMVGLANGHIWLNDSVNGWRDAANRPTAIQALAGFKGAAQIERAVAGIEADELYEQVNPATWVVGRTLTPPDEPVGLTITGVTALLQWVDGETDKLLIGTTDNALLGVLERSQLTTDDAAIQVSNIAYPAIDPIPGDE